MSERIRTLIVDDEPLARLTIRQMLAGDGDIEAVGECSGIDGVATIERTQPELLFLDVQMPEVDGFDLLEAVGVDRAPTVVFVTAYSEHALRAFEVHAVDYLLKPVAEERFAQALARAKEHVLNRRRGVPAESGIGALLRERSRQTARILVRDRERTRILDANTIDWIEAADYYAQVHAHGHKHLVREPLQKLEERLGKKFLRAHRSALVNLARIQRLDKLEGGELVIILQSGTRVPVSRARRGSVMRALGVG